MSEVIGVKLKYNKMDDMRKRLSEVSSFKLIVKIFVCTCVAILCWNPIDYDKIMISLDKEERVKSDK